MANEGSWLSQAMRRWIVRCDCSFLAGCTFPRQDKTRARSNAINKAFRADYEAILAREGNARLQR